MRFSTVFQQPPTRPAPCEQDVRSEATPPPASELPELPEDLDARVRLIGEWQLGEA